MKAKKRLVKSRVPKRLPSQSTPTHQENLTRTNRDQKPLNNSLDHTGNGLDFLGQRTESQQKNGRSRKSAVAPYRPPASRKVDIKLLLVCCVAFAFVAWVLAALYELLASGKSSLLDSGGEAAPFTAFMLVLNYYLVRRPSN